MSLPFGKPGLTLQFEETNSHIPEIAMLGDDADVTMGQTTTTTTSDRSGPRLQLGVPSNSCASMPIDLNASYHVSANGTLRTQGFVIRGTGISAQPERRVSAQLPAPPQVPASTSPMRFSPAAASAASSETIPFNPADLIELSSTGAPADAIIGKGACGVVKKYLYLPTLEIVALKQINIYVEDKRRQLVKELTALSHVASPYIVGCRGATYNDGQVSIMLEFANRCSLLEVLRQYGALPEIILQRVALHAFRGLQILHREHCIHRDIKPGNILVNSNCELKLTDFGVVTALEGTMDMAQTFVGCLRADEMVRLANGDAARADAVRVGMQLAGELGPVNVIAAGDSAAAMPTSNEFYRITHADGTSYVVTGSEDAMHLVTVRYCRKVHIATQQNGNTKSMMFIDVFDPQSAQVHQHYLQRTYCASSVDADDTWPYAGPNATDPTIVRETEEECKAVLEALWEDMALTDATSLPARAPTLGDYIDLPVKTLAEHPEWWQDTPGHGVGLFRAVKLNAVAEPEVPNTAYLVEDSFLAAEKSIEKLIPRDEHGDPLKYADGHRFECARHYTLLVTQETNGAINYRHLRPGDVVRVVLCLHNPLKGTRCTTENPNGTRARTFLNLEAILQSLKIPLNEEGGVAVTVINPIPGDTGEIDSTHPKFDAIIEANMRMILDELGASRIISFGAYANYRWRSFVEDLAGVFDIVRQGDITKFTYKCPLRDSDASSSDESVSEGIHRRSIGRCDVCHQDFDLNGGHSCAGGAILGRDVSVNAADASMEGVKSPTAPSVSHCRSVDIFHAPHPCVLHHSAAIEDAIRKCFHILPQETPEITEIVKVPGSAQYAPFSVDGNQRYLLANGILTHNTQIYFAPERLTAEGKYSYPSDIWSMGVALWYLAVGALPYPSTGGYWAIVKSIKDDPVPSLPAVSPLTGQPFSAEFRSLLDACLQKDPAKRATATAILTHPYLANAEAHWSAALAQTPVLHPLMALTDADMADLDAVLRALYQVQYARGKGEYRKSLMELARFQKLAENLNNRHLTVDRIQRRFEEIYRLMKQAEQQGQ